MFTGRQPWSSESVNHLSDDGSRRRGGALRNNWFGNAKRTAIRWCSTGYGTMGTDDNSGRSCGFCTFSSMYHPASHAQREVTAGCGYGAVKQENDLFNDQERCCAYAWRLCRYFLRNVQAAESPPVPRQGDVAIARWLILPADGFKIPEVWLLILNSKNRNEVWNRDRRNERSKYTLCNQSGYITSCKWWKCSGIQINGWAILPCVPKKAGLSLNLNTFAIPWDARIGPW
jgi:hypothetical protein